MELLFNSLTNEFRFCRLLLYLLGTIVELTFVLFMEHARYEKKARHIFHARIIITIVHGRAALNLFHRTKGQ